jgi:hypothetical protein
VEAVRLAWAWDIEGSRDPKFIGRTGMAREGVPYRAVQYSTVQYRKTLGARAQVASICVRVCVYCAVASTALESL